MRAIRRVRSKSYLVALASGPAPSLSSEFLTVILVLQEYQPGPVNVAINRIRHTRITNHDSLVVLLLNPSGTE